MKLALLLLLCVLGASAIAKTILRADGVTDTYALIDQFLGGTGAVVEVPDCGHPGFGPHITQIHDPELNRPVFAFHSHVAQDNDRCENFDRIRTEIKTYDKSPPELVAFHGELLTLSWNFKLDSGLRATSDFTHIHQIKAAKGDDQKPIITVTPRLGVGKPDQLEIKTNDSKGGPTEMLDKTELAALLGRWIHVRSEMTASHSGSYFLQFTRLSDGAELLTVSREGIDLWRNGTDFIRPKWGLYRSLGQAELMRDEVALFDSFCVSKGNTDKCT